MTTDTTTVSPSEVLAGLYVEAVDAIKDYKLAGLAPLLENDTRAQERAFKALRMLQNHDAGVRWTAEAEDGQKYTGNGEFWFKVVLIQSRIGGAANYVKSGMTSHLRGAAAAAAVMVGA
tara:strand:- start:331 stop:687 length:357 start_codon:yes stop_codon:yes gene_type:complete